ncbi:MAG TPA: hypothetical protein QGG18_09005, partial [Rhodospirillales bacterium]|nr:hypothetical protein [Rhodospirillales bacterium]
GLFGALLALVYAKLAQKPEEPKSLALVEKMMEGMGHDKERNHAMPMEFVNAIEKKRPAGARGVCPIGAGCDRMVLGHGTVSEITLTPGDRELIELGPEAEIETRTISVKISELDRITGGCRVSFDGEKKRCRGTILDPTVREDGNKYANALTQGKEIEVIVDISLVEGEIKKVMIKKPASD